MPPNGFEVRGAHRDSSAPWCLDKYILSSLVCANFLKDDADYLRHFLLQLGGQFCAPVYLFWLDADNDDFPRFVSCQGQEPQVWRHAQFVSRDYGAGFFGLLCAINLIRGK